jgi:cytochrome c
MKARIHALGFIGALTLSPLLAHAAIDDAAAKQLMKKGGCSACHTVKSKVVGPAYQDVAAKRKAEPDALATLTHAVRAGSKGTYGPIPMPPTGADRLADDELQSLLEWVLTK